MELWRWYLPDKITGKLRPSRWRMTQAEAQARHPGCQRVEGSLELREPVTAGHSFASGLVRRESDGAMLPPQSAQPVSRLRTPYKPG